MKPQEQRAVTPPPVVETQLPKNNGSVGDSVKDQHQPQKAVPATVAPAPQKTIIAPPAPPKQMSSAGNMKIEEVVETVKFSPEQAREKLAQQNAAHMTYVESKERSLLPKQQSIKTLEVEVVEIPGQQKPIS